VGVENFLENSLLDIFEERRVVDVSSWLDKVLRQLGLHDPFLDQLVEGMKTQGSVRLEVALCLCRVVLDGCDLGLELLVE